MALSRIEGRVMEGGHNVPEKDVRRRFKRSIENFLRDYRALADSWTLFNNSGVFPEVVATAEGKKVRIIDSRAYRLLAAEYGKES